ncbi:hypothetical protein [Arthrobacter sp. Ld5]|uniref:hypothetical protein n=1 Tax=Arthrobacter sp. Ld5 TaxID=649152 RepID=UPI003EB84651
MKKLLTLAALLLALTACGSEEPSSEAAQTPAAAASQAPTSEAPQQLSTEETCAELEKHFTSLVESDPSDAQVAELADQLDELATSAAEPLQEPIQTLADEFSKGRDAVRAEAAENPAIMEEMDGVIATVSEECGI